MQGEEILLIMIVVALTIGPMLYKSTSKIKSALITLIRHKEISTEAFLKILGDRPALLESPYINEIVRECIFNSHIELLRLLVEKGVDLQSLNSPDTPFLMLAAGCDDYMALSQFLIEHNVEDVSSPEEGMNGFKAALILKRVDLVKMYLDMGADVNAPSNNGATPLFIAARGINSELIEAMGETCLETIKQQEKQTIKLLFEYGAKLELSAQIYDETIDLLVIAASAATSASLEVLLSQGADPNQYHGELSPLLAALSQEDDILEEKQAKVRLLLKNGAQVDDQDEHLEERLFVALYLEDMARVKALDLPALILRSSEQGLKSEDIFKEVIKEKLTQTISDLPVSASQLFDMIIPRITCNLDDCKLSVVDDLISRGVSKKDANALFDYALASVNMAIINQEARLKAMLFVGVDKFYHCLDTNDEIYKQLLVDVKTQPNNRAQFIEKLKQHGIEKAGFQSLDMASNEDRASLLPDFGPPMEEIEPFNNINRFAWLNLLDDAQMSGITKEEVLLRAWLKFDVFPGVLETFSAGFFEVGNAEPQSA